ncbi:MAG TPA: 50S ribosomal protein L9 [Pyrinomonadaceae bacterium]|nr:50S ribosomal protein L9 [Pyrinomonadaceae bacterium]
MAHTKILLREDVDDLGARGEIVRVKAGYARNYLLPRKLAVEATSSNVKQIEQERAALLKKAAGEKATAEGQAAQLGKLTLEFRRKSGEQGALYGSVTSMDIADALREKGYEIDRHRIHLREPIKRLGDFSVPLRLHREVSVDLQVKVASEGEAIAGHLTPEQEAELAKQVEPKEDEQAAESAEATE